MVWNRILLAVTALLFPLSQTAYSATGPRFATNPLFYNAPAGKTVVVDLKTLLKTVDPSWVLTWATANAGPGNVKPAWAVLDKDAAGNPVGTLTLSAPTGTTGEFIFLVGVNTVPAIDSGDTLEFHAKAVTEPVWTVTEVDLGTTPEGSTLNFDLNTVAKDPSGKPLVFSLNDPSNKFPSIANGGWIDTTNLASGKLTGTPARKDVGAFSGFSFKALTQSGGFNEIPGKGAVSLVFKGPKWKNTPITLPDATQNTDYIQNLTAFVNYSQAAPLSFTVLPGSTNAGWLTIPGASTAGQPLQANAGPVVLKVRVSATHNGVAFTDDAVFNFNVKLVPPSWKTTPVVLPNAFAGVPYGPQDLNGQVTAPFGNTLTFSLVPGSGPAWGKLSADGKFTGTPLLANLGLNEWTAQISDGQNNVTAKVQVTVLKRPPTWKNPVIVLPPGLANVAYAPQDLAPFANDPDGAALTITLVAGSGPSWGSVVGGKFSGTPLLANLGLNEWTVRVSNGSGTADAKVQVTVGKRPPTIKSPIVLPNAKATMPYGPQDISGQASDPDGAPLTFTLLPGGPAWGALSAEGKFSGTPQKSNLGVNTWTVQVSNGTNTASGTLQVTVVHTEPVWAANPIVLPTGTVGVAYGPEDLSSKASSPSGATLTFALVPGSGPAWAKLSADGKWTGIPLLANLGLNEWTATVSDGTNTVATKVQITVVKRAPIWASTLIVLPDALANVPYPVQNLALQASDPDGAPLTFSLVAGGPAWAGVSTDGKFSGTPKLADLGVNTWTVRVSNGSSSANTQVQVTVKKRPPTIQDPIVLPNANAGLPYGPKDLTAQATDPDGVALTFALQPGGPAWASVTTDGKFSGNPQKSDLGANTWTVEVSNGTNSATAKIQVKVVLAEPVWASNPIVLPDATAGLPYGPQDISGQASSPSGAPLTFAIVPGSGPAWPSLSGDGKFTGTPAVVNVGVNQWTVTVTDGTNTASTKLQLKVVKRPPVWSKNPIVLPDGFNGVPYAPQDVSQYASDPDNSALTFSLQPGGQAWGKMSSDGKFSGTPTSAGTFKWTVIASNGINTAPTEIEVTIKNGPPVWKSNPIILPDAFTGVPYGPQDISQYASSPSGLPLTFSLVPGGAAWASLTQGGKFTGTPGSPDVGVNKWTVQVSDGSNTVPTVLQVTVVKRPPVWTKTPVVLPNATVGENYDQDLKPFVSDPDGEALTFLQTSASPWVFVTSSGRVVGTPAASDIGLNKVFVRATNKSGTFADVEVQIQVVPKGKPPSWVTPTLNLGDAIVKKPFTFDLNPWVLIPSGLPPRFRKAAPAPGWLLVSNDGRVTGTPVDTDLGPYTTVFEVSDDGVTWVPVNAFGKVIPDSKPPEINAAALFFTVRVGEDFKENLNQPIYVTDPSGLALIFKLLDGEPWVSVQQNGQMRVQPQTPQLGDHTFQLEVSNTAGGKATAPLHIKVIEGCKPPVMQDPIRYTATVNKPFNGILADKVTNECGTALTFVKNSGKPWLNIAGDGTLTGTPLTPDLGDNFFSVTVTNSGGKATSTLIVKVQPETPDEETIDIDSPVKGARVDNLWVVDNVQDACSGEHCIITLLKENIDAYFDELDRAELHHYGIYLSSDACLYQKPIADSRGKVLLEWDDPYWVKSFQSRVNRSPGRSVYNSPLVAEWQFLSTAGSSIPAPYFQKRVPMEVLYVSDEGDAYTNYNHWAGVSGWTPTDFLNYYLGLFKKVEKPLRTSALAAGYKSYQTIVNGTKGKYYVYGKDDFRGSLRDYAKEVIFRAYVTAKGKIKLSKVPPDPSAITVTLAGNLLPVDKWKYLPATNEVEIYWHLIDLSTLKPGDKIVIRYGAAVRTRTVLH